MITSSYKRSSTTTNRHSLNRKYDRVLARSRTRPLLNSGLLSAAPGYGSVQAARFKEREALFKHLGLTSEVEAQHMQRPTAYTAYDRQASFTQDLRLPRKANILQPRSESESPPLWLRNIMCPEEEAMDESWHLHPQSYYKPGKVEWHAEPQERWTSSHPTTQLHHNSEWLNNVPPDAQPAVPLWWTPHGVFTSAGRLVSLDQTPALSLPPAEWLQSPQMGDHSDQYAYVPRHHYQTKSRPSTSLLASDNSAFHAHYTYPDAYHQNEAGPIPADKSGRGDTSHRPARPSTLNHISGRIDNRLRQPIAAPTRLSELAKAPRDHPEQALVIEHEQENGLTDLGPQRSPSPTFTVYNDVSGKAIHSLDIAQDDAAYDEEQQVDESLDDLDTIWSGDCYLAVDSRALQDDLGKGDSLQLLEEDIAETCPGASPNLTEQGIDQRPRNSDVQLEQNQQLHFHDRPPSGRADSSADQQYAYESSDGEDPLLLRPTFPQKHVQADRPSAISEQAQPTSAKPRRNNAYPTPAKTSPVKTNASSQKTASSPLKRRQSIDIPAKRKNIPALGHGTSSTRHLSPISRDPAPLTPSATQAQDDIETIESFSDTDDEKPAKRVRFMRH